MELEDLAVEMGRRFARTSEGLDRWADPHPGPERLVAEAEYSRVTNAARWRIIGARADAWIEALLAAGVASIERDAEVRWSEPPWTVLTRCDLVTPRVDGGLALVVGRSRIGDVPDAGVTLGVGHPAVMIAFIPDCGCDACDSGSEDVIDELDSYVRPVVSGEFRLLRRDRRSIMVREDGRRSAANLRRDRVDAILVDPVGWQELSGPSWLSGPHRDLRH